MVDTTGIEPVVHKALAEAIQGIYDQHGLMVTDIHAEWVSNVEEGTKPVYKMIRLNIQSITDHDI